MTETVEQEYTKWADKIDEAKARNAINDLSVIAYRILNRIIELRPKKCGACAGRGYFVAPDDIYEACSSCNGTGLKN